MTVNPINSNPIFIVGVHRSGTTLLRFMLNCHPRLYIVHESDFIPNFFLQNPNESLTDERVTDLLNTISNRYRFFEQWKGPRPSIDTLRQAGSVSAPSEFLETLYTAYARQNGAVRWGDKTPIYTNYIDLLHTLFPRAQFIHIIRDGRDAILSMLEKYEQREFHVDVYFAARNWVRRIHAARTSGARLGPERYYEIRYENLVADPGRELQALCTFLNEPYVPEMTQPHELARKIVKPGDFHDPVRHPPHIKSVGRWHQEMSEADLRLFTRVADDLLQELDYEPSDINPKMPFVERIRFISLRIKYETLQIGRRVLQTLGFFPPI